MVRHPLVLSVVLLAAVLTGCGGGAPTGGGGGQPPPDVPILNAIAPSSASAGAAAGYPATLTLSVYGSNFNPNRVAVLWNGTPVPTNVVRIGNPPVVSTTVLTATIPAANLASVGSA